MVTYLHIIDDILRVTGPCSRLFQATTTDLSVAVSTVSNCKSALLSRRSDRKHFDTVVRTAKIFASEHDINPEFSNQRRKIRRRYPDGTVDPPVPQTPWIGELISNVYWGVRRLTAKQKNQAGASRHPPGNTGLPV
jgi:hypothetical protein